MKQYNLFEYLCLDSTLLDAWKTVKQKGSTGGVDGVSITDFDENIGTYLAEIKEGIPQGAILSPLLANLYLHSFDQFILSRTKMYVRYADDFIICCESTEKAERLLKEGTIFLEQRLKLHLNEPFISEIKKGFEFLGITLDNRKLSLSEKKKIDLQTRIQELKWKERTFSDDGLRGLQGIHNYYGSLLPQIYLLEFDNILLAHLKKIIEHDWTNIPNKSTLYSALKNINFFSQQNVLQKGKLKSELVNYYVLLKMQNVRGKNEERMLVY